jgi:hypothetical protein
VSPDASGSPATITATTVTADARLGAQGDVLGRCERRRGCVQRLGGHAGSEHQQSQQRSQPPAATDGAASKSRSGSVAGEPPGLSCGVDGAQAEERSKDGAGKETRRPAIMADQGSTGYGASLVQRHLQSSLAVASEEIAGLA